VGLLQQPKISTSMQSLALTRFSVQMVLSGDSSVDLGLVLLLQAILAPEVAEAVTQQATAFGGCRTPSDLPSIQLQLFATLAYTIPSTQPQGAAAHGSTWLSRILCLLTIDMQ